MNSASPPIGLSVLWFALCLVFYKCIPGNSNIALSHGIARVLGTVTETCLDTAWAPVLGDVPREPTRDDAVHPHGLHHYDIQL